MSVADNPTSYGLARQRTVVATSARAVGPDLLRALAILLVMLVHLPIEATPAILVPLRNYGWLGVDLFFVLSGFLIGTQLFKEVSRTGNISFKDFYLRRAFRILPAYFVVLGLYAAFPLLRDSPAMQPFWRFATFTVNLGFDPRTGNTFSQAWTLSVEEQFYIVLPILLLFVFRRIGLASALLLASFLIVCGIVLRFTIWELQVGTMVEGGQAREAFAVYLRDIYYPTYTRLDGLIFGVLLAAGRFFRPQLYRRFMPPALGLGLGTALVVASVVLFSLRGPLAGTNLFLVFQALPGAVWGFPMVSAGVALILGALLDCERALSRISFPGVAATATLSYSLYLTHKSVYNLDKMFFGVDNLQGVSGFVVYLVTSFLAGFALWYCVERSFLKLRDRLLSAGVSKSA